MRMRWGGKAKQPGVLDPGDLCPSPTEASQEGHGTPGAQGPACWPVRPSVGHFPSWALCSGGRGMSKGMALGSPSSLPGPTGRAEIPESVQ